MPRSKLERVRIERMAQGGDGLGHLGDGRVVFVPRTLPGELVEVELIALKKSFARGVVAELIEPSPSRVEPGCAWFGSCGGCQYWHASYPAELEAKCQAALDTLVRLGKVELPETHAVHAPEPELRGRIRARFHVREGKVGWHGPGSHRVVEVTECPVLDPRLERFLLESRPMLRGLGEAELSVETAGEDRVVAILETTAPLGAEAARALAELDGVSGVLLRTREGDQSLGITELDAAEAMDLEIARGITTSPGAFRQASREGNRILRRVVAERLLPGETLVELFAGAGNLSFAVATSFAELRAYELDEVAVRTARALARSAGLEHIIFSTWDLRHPPLLPEGASILLDPPRSGAPELCAPLRDHVGPTIVYVSCDVACLARDLGQLSPRWRIQALDFVDLFPRTGHLETIATLRPSC